MFLITKENLHLFGIDPNQLEGEGQDEDGQEEVEIVDENEEDND